MEKRKYIAVITVALIIIFFVLLEVNSLELKEKSTLEDTEFEFIDLPEEAVFRNDLGISGIGDPFVLKAENGIYYMYCTSAPNGFYCWKSEDLVHWTDRKLCYVRQTDSWCVDCFWAPEVYFYEGKYYMFYTAKNLGKSLRIGLAVSDSPDGMFEDTKNAPFWDPGYAVIDANVLFDEDGSKYLFYSRDCSENMEGGIWKSEIYGIRLSDDLLSVKGEAVKLISPEQQWEKASGNTWWNEGPEVIIHQNKYYLTYSANCFASPSYSIGYAVSDMPLGPYVKASENPILTSGLRKDVSGPGHHSFTVSPDGTQLWAVYHSHTDPLNPSGDRKVNIDRAGFTEDGKLFINGPTSGLQPVPSRNGLADVTGLFSAEDARLTDGFVTTYKKQKDGEIALEKDENGYLRVVLEAENSIPIHGVAIYPGADRMKDFRTVRLCFDGRLYSKEYQFNDDEVSPLILGFDNKKVESIELIFTLKEGVKSSGLSEIRVLALGDA